MGGVTPVEEVEGEGVAVGAWGVLSGNSAGRVDGFSSFTGGSTDVVWSSELD